MARRIKSLSMLLFELCGTFEVLFVYLDQKIEGYAKHRTQRP